jgi:hypothetical protein
MKQLDLNAWLLTPPPALGAARTARCCTRPRARSLPTTRALGPLTQDTIIRDPFFTEMPKFFGLPFKQLLEEKHPTAWVEFERDLIDEAQLFDKFFKDGRAFDGRGLVAAMVRGAAS